MKKSLLLIGLFLLVSVTIFAQKQTVMGTVSASEDGMPMPGVTIFVKGTTAGTNTNSEGKFKITCTPKDVLVFSFVGMTPQEFTVGTQSEFTVKMKTDVMQLGEVVVTALGIERDKKALGYALQAVKGSDISQADRKSTRLNSSHVSQSRMPSSA